MSGDARLTAGPAPWHRRLGRELVAIAAAVLALGVLLAVRNAVVPAPLARLAKDSAGWQGSWYFPRGGPYILGFDSPGGEARLWIDRRLVVRGSGEKTQRVVYKAGARAVRLEAPPGVRLLWHPPGRRGPLEYVPPSSLAPEPPERAQFGTWAGASPADGLVSALAVLVFLALGLYLCRRGLARVPREVVLSMALAVCVALGARLWDLNAAGQTWDEDVNWAAGRNYVTNWLALDFAPASWTWNYEHPPVMKYVAGLGAQWADGYGPARALSAVMMALGCALLVPIGRRLWSLRVGVLASVIAALSPHLIAHGKIVGHEAPTVLLWALAIWLALRVHDGQEQAFSLAVLRRRLVLLGAVVGLAIFSRFVNVLVAPLVGAIVLLGAPPGRRRQIALWGVAICVPTIALVGLAIWPRLWSAPIEHLQDAWLKLKKPHSPEPYLGMITNLPPWHYFAVYLVATAPAGVLAFALAGLGRAARRWREERFAIAVVLLWLAVPMMVMLSPVRQDGVRYIMPSLLALAMLAAAGVDMVGAWVGRAGARLLGWQGGQGWPVAGAGALVCAYLIWVNAAVHPYYLDYYGEHVGGPAGVARAKRFEVAWWGEGISDAIEFVNGRAAPGARVHKQCVEPSHLTWLRADLWAAEATSIDQADWILVYQPSWKTCPLPKGAELVYEVSAQGAPLARVYEVRGARPGEMRSRTK